MKNLKRVLLCLTFGIGALLFTAVHFDTSPPGTDLVKIEKEASSDLSTVDIFNVVHTVAIEANCPIILSKYVSPVPLADRSAISAKEKYTDPEQRSHDVVYIAPRLNLRSWHIPGNLQTVYSISNNKVVGICVTNIHAKQPDKKVLRC